MTTADEIMKEALFLADAEAQVGDAVSVLLTRADRRIPVVMAKRLLQSNLAENPSDEVNVRALQIVTEALEQGTWAE